MPILKLADEAAYAAIYWGSVYGFTWGWSFRAIGRSHLPTTGPALIVCNHQSFFDPILIGASANRRLTYLARDSLFRIPILGRIMSHFEGVPIDRGFGKEGLQTVLAALDRGKAVLMFPEGERSHTGELQPLKPGVSLLLKRVTCPIVPAAVAGAFAAWPRSRKWPTPDPLPFSAAGRSIATAFGPPIDPIRFRGMSREEMLTDVSEAIAKTQVAAEKIRRTSFQ